MEIGIGLGINRIAAASSGVDLSFGNTAYETRATASNAPSSRRLGMIGDSRVQGDQPGQFAFETLCACGEWIWGDFRNYNYGDGGTSIYFSRTNAAAAPKAVTDGCRTFVVLVGTNGAYADGVEEAAADAADPGAGIPSMTELEKRQYETLGLLSVLDLTGATIFLCNEMPGGGSGGGTDAAKVAHHEWLDTLTAVSAGLSNADLIIVNTWNAVSDGGTGTATELDPQWENDGLHPAFQGQERMARAVWGAMNTHFGTSVHLDFSTPSQNLLDGTSTASVNRGTLPGGWNDFTAADDLTYSTSGTGLDTVLTVTNGGASTINMAARVTPGVVTDGVVLFEYNFVANPTASDTTGSSRDFAQRMGFREADYGTGTPIANVPTDSNAAIASSQDYQMGGNRRATFYVGAMGTGRRIDTLFEIAGGQTVEITRVEIHER